MSGHLGAEFIQRRLLNQFQNLSIRSLEEVITSFHTQDAIPVSEYTDVDLTRWSYNDLDLPVIVGLIRALAPRRHLEFGTWEGRGTASVLQATDSTVWTINLPDGESHQDGSWAYGSRVTPEIDKAMNGASSLHTGNDPDGTPRIWHRTDAGPYIGRFYRENGLGHRVCQIYCDSMNWDTTNYPDGFFDSVLIDGGHNKDTVKSDTRNALRLTRDGGLVIWHDFCPIRTVAAACVSVEGVTQAIADLLPELLESFTSLYWIEPSWILVGDKRQRMPPANT